MMVRLVMWWCDDGAIGNVIDDWQTDRWCDAIDDDDTIRYDRWRNDRCDGAIDDGAIDDGAIDDAIDDDDDDTVLAGKF